MTDSQLVSVHSGSGWKHGSVIRLTLTFEPFLGRWGSCMYYISRNSSGGSSTFQIQL